MRRDLVEAVLDAASDALFEDVVYTRGLDAAVTVPRAIAGVEIAAERFDGFGSSVRTATHMTRALLSAFPNLTRGDLIDDGIAYQVVDFEPIGDGRFEINISLVLA